MISQNSIYLFKSYIQLDTSRGDGKNYSAAIDILARALKPIDFKINTFSIPKDLAGKNRTHLVAGKYISANLPTLLIYNHVDVVPASYADAFKLKYVNGKFYGRGACDHKGSTVAVIDALNTINTKKLAFNLIFWATTDEETDQKAQLDWMTDKLALPADTIVFDPDTLAGGVTVAHLSMAQLELVIRGKAAHSGMSHLGKNAIEDAARVMEFLRDVRTEYEQIFSKLSTFENMGSKVVNRCNVNKISGGAAANIIPDSCALTIDCRYIPEANLTDSFINFKKRLMAFCKKEKINFSIIHEHKNEGNISDHPLARKLNTIYQKISGEGGLYAVMGSTPLAEWTNKHKLPHFGIGVARPDTNMHGVDEFCYEKDMENLSKTLQIFLTQNLNLLPVA